ncbi:protein gurken isoform X2 [Drosophila virilis]
MELQQALNLDGQLSEPDTLGNAAQMPQETLNLAIHGELASIATTTEQYSSTEPWSSEVETTTTTNPTTTRATTTTRTRTIATSTIKTATGEPPPNDSTVQLATDAAISELNEALTTTTATLTPTIPITTTNSTGNRTLSKEFNFRIPCSEEYLKYFCLNGGNCFRWESSSGFSYCECANGYGGERCDSKTESGVYVPFRPRKRLLKTAHVVFSFPMLILLSTVYVLFGAVYMLRNVSAQRRKQQQLHLHKQRFFVSC